MYGPVIDGGQFRLRPPSTDEAETMVAWFADQAVTARLFMQLPISVEAERTWLREAGDDANQILWAVEHEDRLVGTTGLHAIDWKNQHATTGTLLGDRAAWGKGIARELMRLRADYAFTQQPLRKLKSAYLEGNEASRRAQASAGYVEVGRLRGEFFREGRWLDLVLTELYREDWARGRSQSPPNP
jgi:RimJ/RimL family protein N-acetyltransferase